MNVFGMGKAETGRTGIGCGLRGLLTQRFRVTSPSRWKSRIREVGLAWVLTFWGLAGGAWWGWGADAVASASGSAAAGLTAGAAFSGAAAVPGGAGREWAVGTGDVLSSNLLTASPLPNPTNAPQHVLLLHMARTSRAQKNFTAAARHYAGILGSPAPEAYHQTAMLELALMNQEDGRLEKALQIFSQYLQAWPEDPATPEIILRQGLLYREMGVATMALAKFYSVMTSALTLRYGSLEYYQRLVLHAQAEIAETYYRQGQHLEALDFLGRLLKQEATDLNRRQIRYKLVRCLAALGRDGETVTRAEEFLRMHPEAEEGAEVRFMLACALAQLQRSGEALREVMLLLQSQEATRGENPTNWLTWQLRAGNEIGNRMYLEGDYVSALEVYSALARLNPVPDWQLPVLYQVGLVYERLEQPALATATYGQILAREKELAPQAAPGLQTVFEMARWRSNFVTWQTQARGAPAAIMSGAVPVSVPAGPGSTDPASP